MSSPKVIESVVNQDLCIGCGICIDRCPSKAIEMDWNDYGFLIPELQENCDSHGECIKSCPFNPLPQNEVKTENEIGERFLKNTNHHHPRIGKYNKLYAGFSTEYRLTSSSGGIATYVLAELLKRGIVQHVISVNESNKSNNHYDYSISSSVVELLGASKTKYYPVSMSNAFSKISELDGKVAIVGVACFLKAIRLVQYQDQALNKKIRFLVGIICGGVKSRFFTEFLAGQVGVEKDEYEEPQFRIKDMNSTAGDYSFGCNSSNDIEQRTLKMKSVGDMWGTGLFKANACDFCDDVTTELADISLGDAWLKPYNADGKGTNVIVTRSLLSEQIITDGINKNEIIAEDLDIDRFLASQRGGFRHRQNALSFRMKEKNISLPKRFVNANISFAFKIVQRIRMNIRSKSLKIWKSKSDSANFNTIIYKDLEKLKKYTKIYHYYDGMLRKLKFWKKEF